jgi:tetratricopeptide (TPR) repeat protein
MNQPDRDRLLALFGHAAADAPASGPHVADDEELLTAWRLGELSPAEDARFHEHLANCPGCRRYVADLSAADSPATTGPGVEQTTASSAFPTPSRFPWRSVVGVVAALAACVVLAVGWLGVPSTEAREVARAEAEFNEGKPEAALARLMRIPPERLTAREKARRLELLERAAYQTIRGDLEAGRSDEAAMRHTVASAAGATSDRLNGLKVLADNRLTLRPALTAQSGSLLERGYLPNGAKPVNGAVPGPNDSVRAAWEAAAKANPDDPAVLVNAGEFLLGQGELVGAMVKFVRAVELDPANLGGHIGLGLALAADEKFDAALQPFRRALELAPDSAAVLIDLAVCYEGMKDPNSARPYWEKALERTTDPKIRNSIAGHLKNG